jgi:uncharacterized membrane protein YhaH (DUF805 family)
MSESIRLNLILSGATCKDECLFDFGCSSRRLEFHLAAVFFLLVLIVLARILAPLSLKDIGVYVGRLLQQQKKVIALLRVYGLGKFVGIIEAFVILFLLYILRLAVPWIGDLIPGRMSYTPSSMLVRTGDPLTVHN